jgi:anti-sigma B factor antagonist
LNQDTSAGDALTGVGAPVGPEGFSVEIYSECDGAVVRPVGELDVATSGPLERAIRQVEDAGTPPLMLDLRGLSFMDCSGLRVLVGTRAHAPGAHARLTVACGPGQVRRLLKLSGVDQRFEIVEHLTISNPG